jgi:tetratricopeptide (TPR) repeat protein
MIKKEIFLFFLCISFALIGQATAAQTGDSRLRAGIDLYREGRWREAVVELRRVQAANPEQRAEALYWIALSELAAGEYEASIRDMEELRLIDPANPRAREIPYHTGRALYYLGRYDEAVVVLKNYADTEDATRKAAALYWIGECLYSLGQLDQAREIFTLITEQYPQSVKFEAASYRIALINQKKVEVELLTILKWSHEESLKIVEEYQRRERSYDQAIIAYQKRIAETLSDNRLTELETLNAEYQRQLSEAEARISQLEESRTSPEPPRPPHAASPPPAPVPEKTIRLLSLKASALELRNELQRVLNNLSPGGN